MSPDAAASLPPTLKIGASAFNWTPEVIRAEHAATDITVDIVAEGVSTLVEVEPGQLWRSFPVTRVDEAALLREHLAAVGGRVTIVGASLDDWMSPTRRRTEEERLEFLVPQLHAAHALGAIGVRLPIGQAGPELLRRLLPLLHELDLVLFEEAQGSQTPQSPTSAEAYDVIAELDDRHVRLLIDISMLMPAVPVSYLSELERGGVPASLRERVRDHWRDPATLGVVVQLLRSGGVPGPVRTLYMDMVVRFGRSSVDVIRPVLPLVAGFHLKFWDLEDADGRVWQPVRDLGAQLAGSGFDGVLTSEWGGHEWLDADPTEMTRAHIAGARKALGIE
ncbi:restriction endonuclease subunit R [Microbacterium sp. ET2]|uniref:restriction endonuclease subunit R n=1 Tax=Microbacterium albipurpureum TaxID=3050384 RepID=UPI00259CB8AF|nr:restriction endonuclease subunit R [Microbacterium sp. ET2 (Ac-2212)]WJL94465.1 restriction endonuclease subunit R [Microbacterium sp. ET2 (Ac-2212)]